MKGRNNNTRVVMGLAAGVALMVGLAYASVPLYALFCRATGFGGTTQRAVVADPKTAERYVTVLFDGNVDPALPWEFAPDVKNLRVKLGETANVTFHAINHGAATLVGTATYNVQPDKAGAFFDKIQCFCFTEQVLKPGARVTLPVQFYVDAALADDPQNDDVQTITLSYTFFMSKNQGKAQNPGMQPVRLNEKPTHSQPAPRAP